MLCVLRRGASPDRCSSVEFVSTIADYLGWVLDGEIG